MADRSLRVLFLCTQNRFRSPTAEQLFADWPGIETASAGLGSRANPATPELVAWADVILIMENAHREKLRRNFRAQLHRQRIVCLHIPDEFTYMEVRLVEILRAAVPPHLRGARPVQP